MRTARYGRKRIFEVDERNMYNRFGTEAKDILKETASDDFDRDDVERYITDLIADFSRAKSSMQHSKDEAGEEKVWPEQEQEQSADENGAVSGGRQFRFNELLDPGSQAESFESKPDELRRLQDDLKSILAEKREIEEKNQALRFANEDALNKIRALTREKEEAVLGENEAMEKYLRQLKENDDLAAEISNLKSINERLSEEMDREAEAAQYAGSETTEADSDSPDKQYEYDNASVCNDFEEKYGKELVTDSGMELFMMLRGLLEDNTRDNNGVRMTKSWEEEMEETIPGAYPDEQPITRKVRTKSEVSVEYIAGRKNDG